MHYRYKKKPVTEIWADENKLAQWQDVELAVIAARVALGAVSKADYKVIEMALTEKPADIELWKALDKELHHDLEAFVEERRRFLPESLKLLWHKRITSYDIEEPAMMRMLRASLAVILPAAKKLSTALLVNAHKYRYTLMMGETHGQWADLQTFGAMHLSWLADFTLTLRRLEELQKTMVHSKISGPIGKYGSIKPELEKTALAILGLQPYYGATQIMPRAYYLPLAEALSAMVGICSKIAGDLWKGASSADRLWQEPFKKTQTGSTAMPHKKNPITWEQLLGMDNLAKHFCGMLRDTVRTNRERSIEQSCVERVAWEDLFHVTLHTLERLRGTLENLRVYPDRMLDQVIATRGCYAASEVKEVLREFGAEHGLSADEAYRLVQLTAFNVFEEPEAEKLRQKPPENLEEMDGVLFDWGSRLRTVPDTIQCLIPEGRLRISPQLAATTEDVGRWNGICEQIFSRPEARAAWDNCFQPSFHIAGQDILYRELLGY